MSARTQAARQYLDATIQRDEEALAAVVADDLRVVNRLRGGVQSEGKAAALEQLRQTDELVGQIPGAGAAIAGTHLPWQEPVEDGVHVRVGVEIPPNPIVKSVAALFSFNDLDEITEVEWVAEMEPPAPTSGDEGTGA